MQDHVRRLIGEFAEAHHAVRDNAKIMCGQPTKEDIDFCVSGMARVARAEDAVYALDERNGELPQELIDHLAAQEDPGCSECWMSSVQKNNHHECTTKISRWFDTRDALVKYGLTL